MKQKNLLLLLLSLFITQQALWAQAPKREGTDYSYIYKLNKEQVRWMIDSPWISNTNWILTDLVDSTDNSRALPMSEEKGYFLKVGLNDLNITANLNIDQPYFATIQETNEQWWFIMRDTMQNIVKNGKLTLIKSDLQDTVFSYDSSCLCYQVPRQAKNHWFLFEADGEFYYMYMETPYMLKRPKWWKFWKKKKLVDKNYQNNRRTRYRKRFGRRVLGLAEDVVELFKLKPTAMSADPGYMVVNQPKFKHGDTVKTKAFIVKRNGKPQRKTLILELVTYKRSGYNREEVLFTKKIKPITRGAYVYEFAIPDSFKLDQNYTLRLREDKYKNLKVQGKKQKTLVGRIYEKVDFKVEEYELNKITYTWENRKNEYYRGDRIWLYAKAIDANNLPVPDAKVTLKLRVYNVDKIYDSLIRIHDSAFTSYFDTTLACSPDGITPIELPGHLIPNADISITGTMHFINADNKPGTASHTFTILANSRRHYIIEDSNGVRAGYLVQGKDSVGGAAYWRTTYRSGVYKEEKITLPHYQNWDAGALKYELLDTHKRVIENYKMPTYPPQRPQVIIEKTHDSLFVSYNNPLGLEIAYRIYHDDKLLAKGASTDLHYSQKLKSLKPVHVYYTYSWAGGIYTYEATGWVKEKQLNVKIDQPETVYPGQEVGVDITVTDYKNRPVKKTNLTAYSINMEVEGITAPNMPYYGKHYSGNLRKKLLNYPRNWHARTTNTFIAKNNMFPLLQLYNHPYYRMMYNAKAIGVEYDSLTEGKTQMSFFAFDRETLHNKNQRYSGIYVAWVDNEMVFYGYTHALPNAFRVSPGKHKIKLRTVSSIFEFEATAVKGMRALVGINSDSVFYNNNIQKTDLEEGMPRQQEANAYNPRNAKILFITGDNKTNRSNYNNQTSLRQGYIRQGDKTYRLQNTKTYRVRKNTYYAIAPLNEGEVELILPHEDTAITFHFNPSYMYMYDGGRVRPYIESYTEVKLQYRTGSSYRDTAVEIPPFQKQIKQEQEDKKPKTNKIKVYRASTLFGHPMVHDYAANNYHHLKRPMRLYVERRGYPSRMWFFNNDSLEFSTITNRSYNGSHDHYIHPGNYDILLATDTHSYKILRNFAIDSGFKYYFNPSEKGYIEYDSVELFPYIAKVKYLNRGPVVPFYKTPMKLNVKLDAEKAKTSEMIIGEFSVNGRYISNTLVIVEDGKGGFVTAGVSNNYGFYQIPARPGNYTLKFYTPQWDMFYAENITVTKKLNTIAHVNIIGYNARVATQYYNRLPTKQRTAQPGSNGRQPNYQTSVNGNCSQNCGEIRGLVKDAKTGEEIAFATVVLDGTSIGMTTDIEGSYSIKNLKPGTYNIVVKYIGYETIKVSQITVRANGISYANIELRPNEVELTEVTVAKTNRYRDKKVYVEDDMNELYAPEMVEESYMAPQSIQNIPARDLEYSVQSTVETVSLRGRRSKGTTYYVDGVRVVGNEKMNDEKLVDRKEEDKRLEQMLGDANALRIRKDFRDYGYWIPNLITNRKGQAGFTVRIPDNQTQWVTYVPAMDYKCKTGLGTAYMRAYKPITANLSLPRFMVEGDRLQLFGKTVNYTSDSVVMDAILKIDDNEIFNKPLGVRYFDTAIFNYQPKKAGINNLLYQIKMANGYTDGDFRPLNVIENGLLVNQGESRTLKGEVNLNLLPQEGYKNRQVLLTNKKAQLLLAEINSLKNYEYGCVEQTASKLKALLLEKQFAKALEIKFTDEKEIKASIKRLEKIQNKDGSWGWWENGPANIWMTMYATEALYKAQKAGYRTKAALLGASYINSAYRNLSPTYQLQAVNLFLEMGYKNVYREVAALEKLNLSAQDRLLLLYAHQKQKKKVNVDSVAKLVRIVNAEQAFWGQKLYSIYINELQTSALAYKILRNEGTKHNDLLKKVRNYFLSQPYTDRNTIQSATILETFLEDIVTEDQKRKELLPELKLNNVVDKRSTIKIKLADDDTLTISKNGSELYYVYAWKKFMANPTQRNDVFKISSRLMQKGKYTDTVQAGVPVTLHIDLSLPDELEYVMLEVPIPAGFSYESKPQLGEHTEYFEDKASIFFTKIKSGHYRYTITLLPKFKGTATLLPAQAEEMYFPIHSGNNTKRVITIK